MAVGDWKPFISATDADHGPAAILFSAILQEAGLTPEYHFSPWARAKSRVEEGTHAASFPWRETPERLQLFHFSTPLMVSYKVFFYRTDRHPDLIIDKKSDVGSLVVAGVYEYAPHEQLAAQGIHVQFVSDDEQMFSMLHMGRVDLVYETPEVGRKFILEKYPEEAHLYAETGAFDINTLHAIFSRSYPGGKQLAERFNIALERMHEDGRYDELLNRLQLRPSFTANKFGAK